tara:strand:- start:120 stop:782 length:663 start_codon:yes stop_codon:yes gene_type:complete
MKIVLIGYRPWALSAFETITKQKPSIEFTTINNPRELLKVESSIILGAGWSWVINQDLLNKNKITALVHPSNLPDYAGGSPIQHQIIDGLTCSKATLFEVTKDIDGGPILYKTDLCLKGHMDQIFNNLRDCTVKLFLQFIDNYPNLPRQQQSPKKIYRRIKPEDSKFLKSEISRMTAKQLYNYIRCKESPYPNMYIEDKSGKLYFKKVEFIPNDNELSSI